MYEFDYARPASLADAVTLLRADGNASLLAGGQTLLPTLRQRLAQPSKLIDLSALGDLTGITKDGNRLRIGAMTTHASVAADNTVQQSIPALAYLANLIGDPQVRHCGTIGGSVANNDPAADWPAAVLGLGANIETDRREVKADDYFMGLFQTALEPGEIIKAIAFQIPEKAGYAKFEQPASRFALVGVFISKSSSETRVAVTGAGDSGVFRSSELEARLAKDFSINVLDGAKVSDANLLSDLHAGPAYRAALIPVMAERAVQAAG